MPVLFRLASDQSAEGSTKEEMMGLRGPHKSAERIELEKESCATCGAKPGKSCLTPSGFPQGSKMVHAARRTVAEQRELESVPRRTW